jgi:hypothetical protein
MLGLGCGGNKRYIENLVGKSLENLGERYESSINRLTGRDRL